MNRLSTADRVRVIAALVEGCSINSTVRMVGVSKPTILKFLVELGAKCQAFHDERVRGLTCRRVQCDEVWAFCHCKAKNVPADRKGMLGMGDVWTWGAIDADTKLMVSWMIGHRDAWTAHGFMRDVASRLANRVQLTTDAHHAYWDAVGRAFDDGENFNVDYAQLVKVYGTTGERTAAGKYSPPECVGTRREIVFGAPDPLHVSTSYIERSNLTVRMGARRYTRLTNAFSKKVENHGYMTSIFYTYYNWCRVHQTLRITPAMAAGLTDHQWEISELIDLVEADERAAIAAGALKRGKYKKPA